MVIVNGCEKEEGRKQSVKELLLEEGYVLEKIAVEKNGRIIPREKYETEWVSDGDHVEIVSFVGGG